MTLVAHVVLMVEMEPLSMVCFFHRMKALKVALVVEARTVMEEEQSMEVVEVQEVRHLARVVSSLQVVVQAVSFPQEV